MPDKIEKGEGSLRVSLESVIGLALLVFSIVLHEVAHAFAAFKLGDPTAARAGRLSLNPLVHIDPVMTIILPAICYFMSGGTFIFGGAKPVPVNVYNFRNLRRDSAICAAAGPAANIFIAAALLLLLCIKPLAPYDSLNWKVFLSVAAGNWVLAMFNLLPIPPLDGSKILMGIAPWKVARLFDMPFFGGLILVILFVNFLWGMVYPFAMWPLFQALLLVEKVRAFFPGGPDIPGVF
jgi:Zn-dependent protease